MCRILVVDDEPDQRFLLRRLFERVGHEVAEASDGAGALASVAGAANAVVPKPYPDAHLIAVAESLLGKEVA